MIALNAPAPDFELPDPEGRPHRLSDARGRILVLDFWSAECPWSQRAADGLNEYQSTWGQQVLVWHIASNANEPPELLRSAAEAQQVSPLLLDAGHAVADRYAAQTTPHLFIIDPAGLLRYRGAFDDVTFRRRTPTRSYVRYAVDTLLQGRLPDPPETPAYGCTIIREI